MTETAITTRTAKTVAVASLSCSLHDKQEGKVLSRAAKPSQRLPPLNSTPLFRHPDLSTPDFVEIHGAPQQERSLVSVCPFCGWFSSIGSDFCDLWDFYGPRGPGAPSTHETLSPHNLAHELFSKHVSMQCVACVFRNQPKMIPELLLVHGMLLRRLQYIDNMLTFLKLEVKRGNCATLETLWKPKGQIDTFPMFTHLRGGAQKE